VRLMMEDPLIDRWPPTLKTQLSFSGSHKPLFESIGQRRSFIGIFELFSRTPLPAGTSPVMSRIPKSGSTEIDKRLLGPGESSALHGYSVVVVSKAIDELLPDSVGANLIRQLIHECMHEALKIDALVHDITTAARTLARLNLSSNKKAQQPAKKLDSIERTLKLDFKIESLTDRPQDWKSSHWWTGE